jgi:hypothetical protein
MAGNGGPTSLVSFRLPDRIPLHFDANRVHSIQMGSAIVFVAMLCVFFIQDVQLLAAAPRSRMAARLGVYGAINAVCLTALAFIVASGRAPGPLWLLHTSSFWVVSVVWHGLIWLFCMILNGRDRPELGWLAALFPAPVPLVSMASVMLLIRFSNGPVEAAFLAALLAACWWVAISLTVLWLQFKAVITCDARIAVDFAGMTNATALLLVPLTGLGASF